jgi:hypothetical protein
MECEDKDLGLLKDVKEWYKQQGEEGLTLKEVLELKPELKELPEFSDYCFAGESMFEMVAKYMKEKVNLIAERNNKENKFIVDFKIINPETKETVAYCDMEADFTHAFLEDGYFRWWKLTIPAEKEKYFFRDKPFFYIKYSEDMKWCYVIDGWASREKFIKTNCERNMGGQKIKRLMMEGSSCSIFNRKEPYGIHRCPIQDWLKCIAFFMNKRYTQFKVKQ